jgi:DNA-binding transcriptional ArsR family regulator
VIGDGQKGIDWLTDKIDAERAKENGHVKREASPSSPHSDEAVIEKCRAADNAVKFADLYDHGDVHAHHGGDDSVADLALLSMLSFYTQDAAQLERLFSNSALGRRGKWRRRRDYRERTISKALSDLGEFYKWPRERARQVGKSVGDSVTSPYIASHQVTRDEEPALSLVRFASRPTPEPREFIVPDLIPRYHPTTLYGWGGTAKSLIALLLAMSVASGREKFFGRDVTVHGPAIYIDFELDADEQHRRVMQLTEGMKIEVPEDLLYVSALGVRTHDAIEFALSMCDEYDVALAVLDSLGPAMVGDMAAARDVIEFHNCYIAPFKALGVTPILVDHQARQQSGEGYQAKGAFGSAYKEHLSRSLIQVEAGDRSAERGTLNVRLRHKKTNFGALAEPFDVSLSFSDEMIVVTTRDLTPADRAQEATLNARDRVVAALEDGPAYPDEIQEATGLARSTVRNTLGALKKSGRVEPTGEVRGQFAQVDLVTSLYKEKSPKSPAPAREENLLDEPMTVAELFANPPDWLPKQLEVYRKNPDRHLKPLCATVASVVLGDPLRGDEVREEVEEEVGKGLGSG